MCYEMEFLRLNPILDWFWIVCAGQLLKVVLYLPASSHISGAHFPWQGWSRGLHWPSHSLLTLPGDEDLDEDESVDEVEDQDEDDGNNSITLLPASPSGRQMEPFRQWPGAHLPFQINQLTKIDILSTCRCKASALDDTFHHNHLYLSQNPLHNNTNLEEPV